MPLVKSIVELHAGSTDIDSEGNCSTTVETLYPPKRVRRECDEPDESLHAIHFRQIPIVAHRRKPAPLTRAAKLFIPYVVIICLSIASFSEVNSSRPIWPPVPATLSRKTARMASIWALTISTSWSACGQAWPVHS